MSSEVPSPVPSYHRPSAARLRVRSSSSCRCVFPVPLVSTPFSSLSTFGRNTLLRVSRSTLYVPPPTSRILDQVPGDMPLSSSFLRCTGLLDTNNKDKIRRDFSFTANSFLTPEKRSFFPQLSPPRNDREGNRLYKGHDSRYIALASDPGSPFANLVVFPLLFI